MLHAWNDALNMCQEKQMYAPIDNSQKWLLNFCLLDSKYACTVYYTEAF